MKAIQLAVKRVIDLCACLILLIVFLPVLILIAIIIKLDSRGPVIFRQIRVGQHQRKFECYKFRSMHVDNDESMHEKFIEQLMTQGDEHKDTATQTYEKMNEKRVTRVGKVLRKFKLDELPQIWNVIKGDMSLVGPRPAIEYEIKFHDQNMLRRFEVKSGISGFWQVHSGRSVDYRHMVSMDLYYVDNWSLLLDFKIIFKTIPVLLRLAGFKVKSGSIFENSFSILLIRMSYYCSSFIILSLMGWDLGPEQVGLFSVVIGLYTIFQLISILGYDIIVMREVAKDQNKATWLIQHGIVLGILSSTACVLLMGTAGRILNYSPFIMRSVFISSIGLFPYFLNLLAENLFIGLKKAKFAFYSAIVREMSWLFLSVWWLNTGKDFNAVIEAFIVSRVIGVAMFAFFLRRQRIYWWEGFHWFGFKEIIDIIPTFFLINLLSNLILEVDVIILSKLVPIADVGFYKVAKGILRVSFVLIFSMITGLFPNIVEVVHKKREDMLPYFNKLTFQMVMISIIVGTAVYIFAHALIIVFFPRFIPSVAFIHLLIWKIIPLCLVFLWSRFLLAANQQNKDLLALLIGLPLFLILGILFVKRWGAIGMAYADILTLTILALVHLYFLNQTIFKIREKV